MKRAALLLSLALIVAGCTTASNPGLTISGTITGLTGEAGELTILTATTTEGIPFAPDRILTVYAVSSGETSKDYSVTVPSDGTYYILAVHMIGSGSRDPGPGDKAGGYALGGTPPEFGQTPSNVPDPITVSGSSVSGKDFELKVTWGGGGGDGGGGIDLPGVYRVSGSVSFTPGIEGALGVYASTDPEFLNPDTGTWANQAEYPVETTDDSIAYSLDLSPGLYYICAVLYKDSSSVLDSPRTGDHAGQYDNGGMPARFNQTPINDPLAILVINSDSPGNDFFLNVTWFE